MRQINAKFDYMHYCCELQLPVGKISASSIWTAIFFKLFDSHVKSVFINACTVQMALGATQWITAVKH
jgi:hypothetical protein